MTLRILGSLAFVLSCALATAQSVTLEIQNDDDPAGGVGVATVHDGERQTLGSTDANGTLGFDAALLLGKIRGETIVRECPSFRQVVLVPMDEQWDCRNDEEATGEEDCPCRRGGAWLLESGRILVQLQPAPFYTNPLAMGGILGGATVLTVVAISGDDSSSSSTGTFGTPDPLPQPMITGDGTWVVVILVQQDPFFHAPWIQLDQVTRLTSTYNTGSSFRFTGLPPWVAMNGTFNGTTGAFNVTGTGTVAGINNVLYVFQGTITGNQFSGTITVGGNNTLPQGPAVYTATGTR